MNEHGKERTYGDAEVEARLKRELPHWTLDGGFICRKYRTHGWKGTLMVINAVGHLAEAAWHHPEIAASYSWVEVRLQNLLRPADFPYDTGYPSSYGAGTVVYDSGDYPAYLERARALIEYDAVRRAQPRERRAGRYRGVAVTAFLEATGLAAESARVARGGARRRRATPASRSRFRTERMAWEKRRRRATSRVKTRRASAPRRTRPTPRRARRYRRRRPHKSAGDRVHPQARSRPGANGGTPGVRRLSRRRPRCPLPRPFA